MNEIYPGYMPGLNSPLYWQNEASGQLKEAVMAFFAPYAQERQSLPIPAMRDRHLELIKSYLIYYIKAPCWRENPYTDSTEIIALDKLTLQAENIKSRQDISKLIDGCLELGIDLF